MTDLARLAAVCGLRLSAQRRVVLEILRTATEPLSAREIHARVLHSGGRVSLSNIYHTLRALQTCGLITTTFPRTRTRLYRQTAASQVDQIIDVSTSRRRDFRSAAMQSLIEKAALDLGYQLLNYRLELFVAPPCAAPAQGTRPRPSTRRGSALRLRRAAPAAPADDAGASPTRTGAGASTSGSGSEE